jgi:hypothetical protein
MGDPTVVPTAAATNETDEKTSRDKFITCVFLAGVDTKKYGRLKTKLNNAYVAGQNNYPKRVESAVTMLAHQMNEKCWTNMRTRTKRTRGAGNPDAFIRLNTECD